MLRRGVSRNIATCRFSFSSARREKAILIMGSTGIGKSGIARGVSKVIKGELLSVDSVKGKKKKQESVLFFCWSCFCFVVYKHLTIGSHKVYNDLSPVRLYDLAEPSDHFTAAMYCDAAIAATREVLAKKRVPIFFGGASMYAEWLFFGLGSNPTAASIFDVAVSF
jgi:tRNA dimethylallyltransferase